MKKSILALCLAVVAAGAWAQGTIKFANTSSTLISLGPFFPFNTAIPANDGTLEHTFYFAVLSASVGTTDPYAFAFAGVYATNTTNPGRLQGGNLLAGETMTGWAPGETRSFEIIGWSADGGATFDPAWLNHPWTLTSPWYLGFSTIGTGAAGGVDPVTGLTLPALAAFSGSTIPTGFALGPIPEPTTMTLAALSAALFIIRRRTRGTRP